LTTYSERGKEKRGEGPRSDITGRGGGKKRKEKKKKASDGGSSKGDALKKGGRSTRETRHCLLHIRGKEKRKAEKDGEGGPQKVYLGKSRF